jgi:two-component system, OmpR family, sensor histidine kinase TctE
MAVQKEIDLSLDAEGDAMVEGQARMLRELVSNLVDNALRYTPAQGRVALRVAATGGAVLLEVQDSGCGIPAPEREKVFTPFYRSAASFEFNPGGTGLGLAIVHDIARVHHAAVTLGEADQGPGLKVSVLFAAR